MFLCGFDSFALIISLISAKIGFRWRFCGQTLVPSSSPELISARCFAFEISDEEARALAPGIELDVILIMSGST